MNDPEELAEKYHKLFQDYTRIKAQHAVLKKAVLKSLQDLDLLSFHNQRLTKRITSLQELATSKSGGSWLMGGGSAKKELEKSQQSLEAATIDLQTKIEENEKLHQQLYEINALYPRHVTELQSKIQSLEKQNQELQLDVQRAGTANEDTIAMVRKEKDDVEKELGIIRNALADQLKDEQKASQSLQENVKKLEADVERLSKTELELETLQNEHMKLREELETSKWFSFELSQLQEAYRALEQDKLQLDKAHTQLNQYHSTLKQTEDSLRRALDHEQKQSKLFQEKTQQLNDDLANIRNEAAQQDQTHLEKITQLEAELAQVRGEHGQLQTDYKLKLAEQSAHADLSKDREEQAAEMAEMETRFKEAEARIKELEEIQKTLEKGVDDVGKTLEDQTKLPVGGEKESTDDTLDPERQQENNTPSTESKPVDKAVNHQPSKNSKKKKRKSQPVAMVDIPPAESGPSSAAQKDTIPSELTPSGDLKQEGANSPSLESLTDNKQQYEEQVKKFAQIEESLKAEIESLRLDIQKSHKSHTNKQQELDAAQEIAKDEKSSLSISLEAHVELTMQLQQEIEELKSKLPNKQAASSPNGALSKEEHKADDNSSSGVKTLECQTPPMSTSEGKSPSLEDNRSTKDEATQIDITSVDKAIQLESVSLIDEGTQVDLSNTDGGAAPNGVGSAIDGSSPQMQGDGDKVDSSTSNGEGNVILDDALAQGSVLGGDEVQIAATTINQSNRELLIKQHYETKLHTLSEQLQLSDSRFVKLHREFDLLKDLLLETVKEKEQVQREHDVLRTKNSHLQEELTAAKASQQETFMRFTTHGRPGQNDHPDPDFWTAPKDDNVCKLLDDNAGVPIINCIK
ncbi:hypothetical protein BGW38_010627 [Lunasporangiospora selenospora]|uniref:Protein phosphatase 1 regulatory subunit 21 N-terminal domain-containing protein n=1 Tax=Lunasporangiospora selenospora TaxID=979761 RepID=A0A9P6KIA2_9FUNG|nr:hypothetical protein BGW38_010627 [Lunasporangiospora selenospora]